MIGRTHTNHEENASVMQYSTRSRSLAARWTAAHINSARPKYPMNQPAT